MSVLLSGEDKFIQYTHRLVGPRQEAQGGKKKREGDSSMSLPSIGPRADRMWENGEELDFVVKRNLVPIPILFAVRSRALCMTSCVRVLAYGVRPPFPS